MIRLLHRDTGDSFWVHESRLDEYLERGHRLPPPPPLPPKPDEPKAVSGSDIAPAEKPRRKPGRPKSVK